MSTLLSFLSSGTVTSIITYAILAFTIASTVLNAVASVFVTLGDSAPGWLGTVTTYLGTAIHFLNGNVPAAISALKQTPPASK